MSLADNAARMIAEKGKTMTLAREGEGTTIDLKGVRQSTSIIEVGGSAAQQQFKVRIAPTEIAASAWSVKAPRRHDTLTVDGRAREVLDARPISDGATIAMYELEVAG